MVEKKMLLMLVLAQLMNETLDEIKETEYDRGHFKKLLNQIEFHIAKNFNKKIDKIFSGHESQMNELMRNIEEAVSCMSTLKIEELAYFGEAVKKYKRQLENE